MFQDMLNRLRCQNGVEGVVVESQKWKVRVGFDQGMLMFQVEEVSPFQVYFIEFGDSNIYPDLAFYGSVERIYRFIQSEPTKRIDYNQLGKYILVMDYVGGRLKMIKVQLVKLDLTEIEVRDRKLKKIDEENKKLQIEISRLKSDSQSWQKREIILNNTIKNMENDRVLLIDRIKRQQYRLQLFKAEKQALKQRCDIFLNSQEKEEKYLEQLIKKRKINNGVVISERVDTREEQKVEKEDSEVIADKQDEVEESNVNQFKDKQFRWMKPSKLFVDVEAQSSQIIFQEKMKYSIPKQLNSSHFAFALPTIKKLSSSEESRLIFLISEQCVKSSLRRASRVFVSFQNLSNCEQMGGQQLSLMVGIIESNCINLSSVEGCKSSIYWHTGKQSIYWRGIIQKSPNSFSFDIKDIINMVLDIDQETIEWYLNGNLIVKMAMYEGMLEEGIHPFIELKTKNSMIEIL